MVQELRIREEALENQVLEKDSKLLEMEYKLQKKERVRILIFFSTYIIDARNSYRKELQTISKMCFQPITRQSQ